MDLDPGKLENSLKEIGNLCQRWEALLLIDEADIFLESRNLSEITRNSIVGIFLKFLEYNKNTIFLTTNRLQTIDNAIKSRINLIVTYPQLNEKNRLDIWKKLLEDKNLIDKNNAVKELCKLELNGREISNILNLVMNLVYGEKNDNEKEIPYDKFMYNIKKCISINNECNFNCSENTLYL